MSLLQENKYLVFDRPVNTSRYIVRRIVAAIASPYYKAKMFFAKPVRHQKKQHYVSICAIFRDEAPYLRQWIEYHLLIGFDHFYLYNNFSKDDYASIVLPYVKKGLITLIDWPYKQGQMAAYKNCVDEFSAETQWIAFIDLDEYVVPNHDDTIGDFLLPFERKRPVVIAYWKYIGSSGILKRDISGLIIEDFTIGWEKYAAIGKCFFNTSYEYIDNYKNGYMHSIWAKSKGMVLPPVNCFDRVCVFGNHSVPCDDLPIQINHYLLKSYDEYFEKKAKRGGGVHEVGFHTDDYFFFHEHRCQSLDVHAYKYLVELKLRMFGGM